MLQRRMVGQRPKPEPRDGVGSRAWPDGNKESRYRVSFVCRPSDGLRRLGVDRLTDEVVLCFEPSSDCERLVMGLFGCRRCLLLSVLFVVVVVVWEGAVSSDADPKPLAVLVHPCPLRVLLALVPSPVCLLLGDMFDRVVVLALSVVGRV